jgi:phosphoenolpyruvate phosphomutase
VASRTTSVWRIAGVADAIGAILAERSGFEGLWLSSLCLSVSRGLADEGVLTLPHVVDAARVLRGAAALPTIVDCDTGFGDREVVAAAAAQLEAVGMAAMCMEDQRPPKHNSLGQHDIVLEDPRTFAGKIAAAALARSSADFHIFARIESLVAGQALADALGRARCYVAAGADGIIIHSRSSVPYEVIAFAQAFRAEDRETTLAVIPTTYYDTPIGVLGDVGVDMVIYANQAARAAVRAMEQAYHAILAEGSSATIEDEIAPVRDLLGLVPEPDVHRRLAASVAWDAGVRAIGTIPRASTA